MSLFKKRKIPEDRISQEEQVTVQITVDNLDIAVVDTVPLSTYNMLKTFEKIQYSISIFEGGCCGQTRCIFCCLNNISITVDRLDNFPIKSFNENIFQRILERVEGWWELPEDTSD